MRFHLTPAPLLHLITTLLLNSQPAVGGPHPARSAQSGFSFNELFARYECSGDLCGYDKQLCCSAGSTCYTDSNDQAQCATGGVSSASAAAGGHWEYYTTVYTETDLETITSVMSSYVGGSSAPVSAAATGTMRCNYALGESSCGSICCNGQQYCAFVGQCSQAYAGQTTTTAAASVSAAASSTGATGALPPVRGTSSSNTKITKTETPTTTVPFETPVATGANVTMTETSSGGGGLSGGAIAGIVIGVLIGLAILGLICFYCCIKGLLDGCLAFFGLGKRRRTTEVDTYERRTHHGSGGGGGRTWYGAAKPSRVERRERESHSGRNALALGGGLAALWAILGLKRRHEKREQEKYSEYSYESDYYTSSSSASSDDRRTRRTHDVSVRRSGSRRP